ncbi:hypothetical protein C2845_PM07G37870 [Panicum miliaceum]|uniref:Uncharacterized protein n=1 Tax=Panicum miliaceum TaxID=4540 RepID=A0A3L6SS31_PANMI|nr:hypothetical protein C2845_PM07G37870 [Panicum miliaceum]
METKMMTPNRLTICLLLTSSSREGEIEQKNPFKRWSKFKTTSNGDQKPNNLEIDRETIDEQINNSRCQQLLIDQLALYNCGLFGLGSRRTEK